jgi:UDP-N-acetylglucosamine 1-carboxyvinyltransferase
MPDRIAAATLLAAGASAGGDIFVKGARGLDMVPALNVLRRMGAEVSDGSDGIRLRRNGHLRSAGIIETAPYPGFPTDMQAPFMAVACSADGVTTVNENVFENRFRHVPELMKLGADITVSERTATVTGVTKLRGGAVEAAELRGGAALIIAGLAAEGMSTVSGRKYIDRGYENIARDLTALGVKIEGAKKEE